MTTPTLSHWPAHASRSPAPQRVSRMWRSSGVMVAEGGADKRAARSRSRLMHNFFSSRLAIAIAVGLRLAISAHQRSTSASSSAGSTTALISPISSACCAL